MVVLSKESQQSRAHILAHALDYFGPDGEGLEVINQDATSVSLQGGGGFVIVRAQTQPDRDLTTVEIESREWDYQAEQFLEEL